MKKPLSLSCFFTGLLLIASGCITAQTTWTTTAGNTLTPATGTTLPGGPNQWLGTANAADLIFKTNSVEKFRLTSGGNIGIGTTVPQRRLVISDGAIGTEISPFTTYNQLISYNRSTSAYVPLVLQDAAGGNVGVGNTAPAFKLSVQTSAMNNGVEVIQTGVTAAALHLTNSNTSGHHWGMLSNGTGNFEGAGNLSIYDWGAGGTGGMGTCLLISGATGNVGIGTGITAPTAKLTVNGNVLIGDPAVVSLVAPGTNYKLFVQTGILTEKIKVAVTTSTDWSDYVFDDAYKLKSIAELETFLKTNKHLPNIPSADEVVKEGLDLGKMDAKLLEKIEELSLYIIQLNKRIDVLEKTK